MCWPVDPCGVPGSRPEALTHEGAVVPPGGLADRRFGSRRPGGVRNLAPPTSFLVVPRWGLAITPGAFRALAQRFRFWLHVGIS